MTQENPETNSQLIPVLREGLSVVQMIVFKEIRASLTDKYPGFTPGDLSMLAGAIVSELFGSPNPGEKFVHFRKKNWGIIEQELLSLHSDKPMLCAPITDAPRIMALCDSREGNGDGSAVLIRANELGILIKDREIPLPSSFMTLVRNLGKEHNLILPPVRNASDQDQEIVH